MTEAGEISVRLIEAKPLQSLRRTFDALRRPLAPLESGGKQRSWRNIGSSVTEFMDGTDLSNKVQSAVKGFVQEHIPFIQEQSFRLRNISPKDLLSVLTEGNLGGDIPDIEEKRTGVLLTILAHVVKRMETVAYRTVLQNASEEQLALLGLDRPLRNLLVDIMETSVKTDPLFIRFLAFQQLGPNPPPNATPENISFDENIHYTLRQLFPNETKSLAKGLTAINQNNESWIERPGGKEFATYLDTLAQWYDTQDTSRTQELHARVAQAFEATLASGFSIVLTPAVEGHYNEPYLDPELRVSLITPESTQENAMFKKAQLAMSGALKQSPIPGLDRFADPMRNRNIQTVITLGAYGVNITMDAVAQERPWIVLYLNSQIEAYDREFPKLLSLITNTENAFKSITDPAERTRTMEQMSRMCTMLHEIEHNVYDEETPEAKRIGPVQHTNINEIKVESMYKAFIPSVLQSNGLEGTEEQWAVATLASSLQLLRDSSDGDEYFYAASYPLNRLFDPENHAVTFDGTGFTITDVKRYYEILESATRDVVNLYQDERMNENRAKTWLKKHATPTETVRSIKVFMDKLDLKEKSEASALSVNNQET